MHSWQASYRSATLALAPQCAAVAARYGDRVAQYGYSLTDLSAVAVTALLQPYMLD